MKKQPKLFIDPLFGERRSDSKARLEATVGNKRKSNVSIVVE